MERLLIIVLGGFQLVSLCGCVAPPVADERAGGIYAIGHPPYERLEIPWVAIESREIDEVDHRVQLRVTSRGGELLFDDWMEDGDSIAIPAGPDSLTELTLLFSRRKPYLSILQPTQWEIDARKQHTDLYVRPERERDNRDAIE